MPTHVPNWLLLFVLASAAASAGDCPAPAATFAARIGYVDELAARGQLDRPEAGDCLVAAEAMASSPLDRAVLRMRATRRLIDAGNLGDAATQLDVPLPTPTPDDLAIEQALLRAELAFGQVHSSEVASAVTAVLALLAQPANANPTQELRARLLQVRSQVRERRIVQTEFDALLALAERSFPHDSHEMGAVLLEVAAVARVRGDHGASLDALERVLGIESILGEIANPRVQSRALVMLAQTRKLSGDYERAAREYDAALAWLKAHPEPVPVQLASALHGIANLHRDLYQVDRSLEDYAQAIPAIERAFGAGSVQSAQVLNNYGNALGMAGRYDEAMDVYSRALVIAEKLGRLNDPSLSAPIGNRALIHLWRRDFHNAEPGFRRSLEILKDQPVASETSAIFAHLGLAASLWGQGQHRAAFASAESAEIERQLAVTLAGARMSEEGTLQFQEILRPSLDMLNAIAFDSADPALISRAWELGMGARGQVTQQTAARLAAARSSANPALRKAFDAWRRSSEQVTKLRLSQAVSKLAPGKSELHDAEAELERSERNLGRASASTLSAVRSASTRYAAIVAALPKDTWLLSYSSGNVQRPEEFALLGVEKRARDVYAFVVRAGATPRLTRLADEVTIGRDVAAWRASAGRPDTAIADVDALGVRLRRAVLDPLGLPVSDSTILVVPDGELARLNLAALSHDDGRYAVEAGLRYFQLNHETDLLLPARGSIDAKRVYAVSDPRYVRTGSTCADEKIAELPGTRREVAALLELLPQRARLTEVHGASAQEANVRSAMPGHDVLHLAMHALDLDGDTRCTQPVRGTRAAGFAFRDAPSTDSARIGALLLTPAPGEDGLLTETEIAALDLSSVRWAVLSACDTALGTSRPYEGAFGLRRAFSLAGARTVIMSLWRIDDDASVEWMKSLYRARWHERADSIGSLHAAMSETLKARRSSGLSVHPYYWAGFVAAGDWH